MKLTNQKLNENRNILFLLKSSKLGSKNSKLRLQLSLYQCAHQYLNNLVVKSSI